METKTAPRTVQVGEQVREARVGRSRRQSSGEWGGQDVVGEVHGCTVVTRCHKWGGLFWDERMEDGDPEGNRTWFWTMRHSLKPQNHSKKAKTEVEVELFSHLAF